MDQRCEEVVVTMVITVTLLAVALVDLEGTESRMSTATMCRENTSGDLCSIPLCARLFPIICVGSHKNKETLCSDAFWLGELEKEP